MTDRSKESPPAAAPRDPAAALAHVDGPAWIIDWVAAEVVAATAEGGERMPASTGKRRASLDAAMPGFARLRQMAGSGRLKDAVHEHLILWTTRGAEALRCRIEPIAGDRSGRLLLVVAEAAARAVATGGEAVNGSGEAASRPRSDFETLQAIARQIREGKPARPAAPLAADPEGDPPPKGDDETPAVPSPQAPPLAASDPGPARRNAEARLAHELKTPLSAIAVAAEMMREERLGRMGNERYREYATDIHENARHALAVVQRMLGGNRGEATIPEQSFAEVDLNKIVAASAQGLALLAERAGVTFDCVLQPRLPHIIADETSVRQMLINLATNALKFTPLGGRVLIATTYLADGRVEMSVQDTGTGMSRRAIDDVLADREGDDLLPRPGGGLGIGLPLVKRLATVNGGSLSITSETGAGTRAAVAFGRDRVVPV